MKRYKWIFFHGFGLLIYRNYWLSERISEHNFYWSFDLYNITDVIELKIYQGIWLFKLTLGKKIPKHTCIYFWLPDHQWSHKNVGEHTMMTLQMTLGRLDELSSLKGLSTPVIFRYWWFKSVYKLKSDTCREKSKRYKKLGIEKEGGVEGIEKIFFITFLFVNTSKWLSRWINYMNFHVMWLLIANDQLHYSV